ncbi:MAG TPA: hypothetical protein VN872_00810 [Candidatus Acidoferrum sp.]|nr:hypothetical protein [Candidatus Acidoferrum sp.]
MADAVANIELEQAEHLAMRMSQTDWVRWPAAAVVGVEARLVLVLRIADKPWNHRAWKPRT